MNILIKMISIALCSLVVLPAHATDKAIQCTQNLVGTNSARLLESRKALKDLSAALLQISPGLANEEWHKMLTRVLATFHTSDLVVCGLLGPRGMGASSIGNLMCQIITGRSEIVSPVGRMGPNTLCPLVITFWNPTHAKDPTDAALVSLGEGAAAFSVAHDQRCVEASERFTNAVTYNPGTKLVADDVTRTIQLETRGDEVRTAILDAPNLTSGDATSRLDTKGDFEPTARDVLLAADVHFLVLNDTFLDNKSLKSTLIDMNEKMGSRRTVILLRTNAKTESELRDSEEALRKATHSFFNYKDDLPEDVANGSSPLPEEILALYTVPEDPAVQAGQAHPSPRALPGSMEFEDLITYINKESLQLKLYAARKVGAASAEQMKEVLKEGRRQHDVTAIFREALGMAMDLPAESLIRFPYRDGLRSAARWRDLAKEERPGFKIHRYAQALTAPARALSGMVKDVALASQDFAVDTIRNFQKRVLPEGSFEASPTRPKLTTEELIEGLDGQIKVEWTRRATDLFNDLELGVVRLPKKNADKLLTRIRAYNAEYIGHEISILLPTTPEEPRPAVNTKVGEGLVTVKLPAKELLSTAARAGLEKALSRGKNISQNLFTDEKPEPNVSAQKPVVKQDAAADPGVTPPAPAEVAVFNEQKVSQGLRSIFAKDTSKVHDDRATDGIHIAATAASGVLLVNRALNIEKMFKAAGLVKAAAVAGAASSGIGIPALIATYVASGGVKLVSDHFTDADLRPRLESWFQSYQASEYRRLVNDKLLGDFTKHLDADLQTMESAQKKVEQALSILIPDP